MQLFGFEILRKKEKVLDSIVSPSPSDGSTIVNTGVNAGGYYGMVVDLDASLKNENDLIRRSREISQYCDCDAAIEDIVNEALISDESKQKMREAKLGKKLSEETKKKISIAHQGNKHCVGKKCSEETKKKIGLKHKGKVTPDHVKLAVIESNKRRTGSKHKPHRNKGVKQELLTCPHCNKSGGTTMYRWHFNNCKLKGDNNE